MKEPVWDMVDNTVEKVLWDERYDRRRSRWMHPEQVVAELVTRLLQLGKPVWDELDAREEALSELVTRLSARFYEGKNHMDWLF